MDYRRIPKKQVEILRELYEITPHEGVPLSPEDFVEFIDKRIHIEYLRKVFEGKKPNSENHNFREFVAREVYFEGIRIEQSGRNEPDLWEPAGEEKRLTATLERLTERAIHLYREIGDNVNDYGKNGELDLMCEDLDMRCDLSRYRKAA
jgi:hypothetical protein